ncbi:MAG: class C sortase [Propionibacteriaceae bacterium]|nr:class C sortase [Propionibacteriaceae bacterium]
MKRRPAPSVSQPPKKRFPIRILIALIVAIVGLGVWQYPNVVNFVYDRNVAAEERQFLDKKRDAIQGEALYEFLLAENERLFQSGQADLVDAFSYQQPGVDLSQYGITDNRIGYLNIPSIHRKLPIILGANATNLGLGSVHLTQTSYPIGGENTNSVLAAHRGNNITGFRDIDKIEIGAELTIDNFHEQLTYRAVETRIIDPSETDVLQIRPGRDLVTLISCHPLGVNTQRYVVTFERVNQ